METEKTGRTRPCELCGKADAYEVVSRVEIQPLGRRTDYERRHWECPRHGDELTDDEQRASNERAELAAKAAAVRDIDGGALRKVRETAGATQTELEALLDVGKNTVARWETGQRPLPGYIATLVRVLALHPTALRELAAIARLERGPVAASIESASTDERAREHPSPSAERSAEAAGESDSARNANRRWSAAAETRLRTLVAEGLSVEDLAERLGRTPNAIKAHLGKLALRDR